MALLRVALAGSVAAGCYAPTLPECTVACGVDTDCAPSQTCGGDGWCASPERAGRCTGATPNDAGIDGSAPDASSCRFIVTIDGKGSVVIDGLVECDDDEDTCTFDLPLAPHDLIAIAGRDAEFDRWTSTACTGQDDACYLATCSPTTPIGVRFVRDD